MVRKVQVWSLSSQNRLYHLCYKSVPFTQKRPRRPETGIKDGLEGMEHEVQFGIFRPEKQDYLFRCSVPSGSFPLGRPRKLCPIYFPTGFPWKFLQMVNNRWKGCPVFPILTFRMEIRLPLTIFLSFVPVFMFVVTRIQSSAARQSGNLRQMVNENSQPKFPEFFYKWSNNCFSFSTSTRKFSISHDFLPILHYFYQL